MGESKNPIDMMCVVAHADDEIFCAGALAHHTRQGRSLVIVIMTDGAGGPPAYDTKMAKPAIVAMRRKEMQNSANILGAQNVEFLDFEDQGYIAEGVFGPLGVSPDDITQKIRALLDQYQPRVILTHGPDGEYGHPHHVVASQCTTEAFEQWCQHGDDFHGQLYYCCAHHAAAPIPFSNISVGTDYIFPVTGRNYETRKKVMLCHVSQLQNFIGYWGRDMAHECYHRVGTPNENSKWFEVTLD